MRARRSDESTFVSPFKYRETLVLPVPASRATSLIVARRIAPMGPTLIVRQRAKRARSQIQSKKISLS